MISAYLPSDIAPEHELMQVGETEACIKIWCRRFSKIFIETTILSF